MSVIDHHLHLFCRITCTDKEHLKREITETLKCFDKECSILPPYMVTDKDKNIFVLRDTQFLAGLLTKYLLCFIDMQVTSVVKYFYMSFETIFAYRLLNIGLWY